MPDYVAQVFVCTNTEKAEDKRHCGDKGGPAIRKAFNELIVKHKLQDRVMVNNVGCTSQHRLCDTNMGSVIVFGPNAALGGTWYAASPADVEEIISEHLMKGRIVERIHNKQRAIKPAMPVK